MPRLVDRNQRNFEAHSAIFQAILMRDPDAAEAALRSHLDAAWDQVRDTFDPAEF
jgi:DNA-binding GntR family transcriptional regulator